MWANDHTMVGSAILDIFWQELYPISQNPRLIIKPKPSNFRPATLPLQPLATTMPVTYGGVEKRISEAMIAAMNSLWKDSRNRIAQELWVPVERLRSRPNDNPPASDAWELRQRRFVPSQERALHDYLARRKPTCERRTRIASKRACARPEESFSLWFRSTRNYQVCPPACQKWLETPQIRFFKWALTPKSLFRLLVRNGQVAGYTGAFSKSPLFL